MPTRAHTAQAGIVYDFFALKKNQIVYQMPIDIRISQEEREVNARAPSHDWRWRILLNFLRIWMGQ